MKRGVELGSVSQHAIFLFGPKGLTIRERLFFFHIFLDVSFFNIIEKIFLKINLFNFLNA